MTLQPLRNLPDSDVPSSIDLRDWHVVGRDGTPLGAVAEVIVDVDAEAPVYLNVVPHEHVVDDARECWIRVPYRHVRVDEDARRVVLDDMAMLGLGTTTTELTIAPERR